MFSFGKQWVMSQGDYLPVRKNVIESSKASKWIMVIDMYCNWSDLNKIQNL